MFRHLNYRPWFAAAEFVDNAIQSFQDHHEELTHVEGQAGKLRVTVTYRHLRRRYHSGVGQRGWDLS